MAASEADRLAEELVEFLRRRRVKPGDMIAIAAVRENFCRFSHRPVEFVLALEAGVRNGLLVLSADGQWLALRDEPTQ